MKNTTPIEMLESSLDLSLNNSLQCIQGKIQMDLFIPKEEMHPNHSESCSLL